MRKFQALYLLLLLAGCSVKEPVDTLDPKASAKWVAECQKKAAAISYPDYKILWYTKAYEHAEAAGILTKKIEALPNRILELAKEIKDEEAGAWAFDHGATPPSSYLELMEYAKLRGGWKEKILSLNPDALSILTSLSIDYYDIQFFNAHAADQIARGFNVKSPMNTMEFKMRFHRFVGEQLVEAIDKNDVERIRFLVTYTPKVLFEHYLDIHTLNYMRAAGDYVFKVLKDEKLAIQMIERRYALHPVDFENLPFGEDFLEAYRNAPEYAIRTQDLSKWDGHLSDAEAAFLITLPELAWAKLASLHLEELIEFSMKIQQSDSALQLIAFKAKEAPLIQADYNELISWALKYSNKDVFDFALSESGELDIYNIDFASLARNQKLFQIYAMKIMAHIDFTLDTTPRPNGTTMGRINQVFACGNEDAGLYLVQNKQNLSADWEEATGGKTLLMDVCEAGNLKVARYLIENMGQSVNVQTGYSELQISIFGSVRPSEGKLSPIFFAAKSGNPKLIKYLASKGANVNARSNFRTTPLMHAVSAGHIEAVKMLIALRADVNVKMNPNLKATDLREIGSFSDISNAYRRARSRNDQPMLTLLQAAGANP